MKKRKKLSFVPYLILIVFLTLLSFLAQTLITANPHFVEEVDFQIFVFGSILFIGYYINRIAPRTSIPSFVWAIFAGMAMQPVLSFFTRNVSSLSVLMEIFGAIILFAGGLEVPFKSFQKWFVPISVLAIFGVILTAVGFAFGLYLFTDLGGIYHFSLIPAMVILGAALASTDPTAIIPTLQTMHLKRNFLKQIAISESALTDVTGSILTRFLLVAIISVPITQHASVLSLFAPLLQKSTYDALALQIVSGVVVGVIGYRIVAHFYYNKNADPDPALLLAVPIFTFVLGNILGGAGFLAAFVSGLLTEVIGGLNKVSHFYESFLSHLIKPFIFIMLGALVPLSTLLSLAPIGIAAGLLFMLVLRPIVVFITLLPWLYNNKFKFTDILFLSFIRETGIIAAILIIIASQYQAINSDFIIAIGMWVILMTLVIEPPLTPYLSEKIGVASK